MPQTRSRASRECAYPELASPARWARTHIHVAGGRYRSYPWIAYLSRMIRRTIARGGRLLVAAPPQHGKSLMTSLATPTWMLARAALLRQQYRILLASYNTEWASHWGRQCRDLLLEVGRYYRVRVRSDSQAAHRVELHGGSYLQTAGIRAGITGRSADLFIIDDPIRNAQEADSPTIRDRIWDEAGRTIETRLQRGAAVIWVQTLWHPDDPAMRIIHSQADPTAPRWTIVRLPALAGTDDPLGRAPGEALCPQRYTADELEARRQSPALGRRGWLALYQQSPVPDEGAIWRSSYWRTHRLSPGGHWLWPDGDESQAFEVAELERYATVDLALGKSHGDQTVIAVWGYSAALGRVFLLDLQAGQYDWPETRRRIRRILEAQEDRPWQRALRVYIEDVQYQEAAVQDLQSDALGVSGITPAGRTKDARLKAVEPWGEQRRISHDADAHWRDALERQLLEFTGHVGDVDDIVDAWSYGVRVAMDGMATSGAPALARPLRPRWQIPR